MDEIVKLIKNNELRKAYIMADEMGLSQAQKYDLFLSDKAKTYNKQKTLKSCSINQSKREMNKIISSVSEDKHS